LEKSLEDIALVMEVIAGPDEFDSTVSHKTVPAYTTELSSGTAKKYRVAYLREIESEGLQPEIKKSITTNLIN